MHKTKKEIVFGDGNTFPAGSEFALDNDENGTLLKRIDSYESDVKEAGAEDRMAQELFMMKRLKLAIDIGELVPVIFEGETVTRMIQSEDIENYEYKN